MNSDPTAINRPVIKACAAWGCAGVARVAEAATATQPDTWHWVQSVPWASLASAAAFGYSLILIVEAIWKKLVRPLAQRMGWIKPRRRLTDITDSEWAAMRPGSDR